MPTGQLLVHKSQAKSHIINNLLTANILSLWENLKPWPWPCYLLANMAWSQLRFSSKRPHSQSISGYCVDKGNTIPILSWVLKLVFLCIVICICTFLYRHTGKLVPLLKHLSCFYLRMLTIGTAIFYSLYFDCICWLVHFRQIAESICSNIVCKSGGKVPLHNLWLLLHVVR